MKVVFSARARREPLAQADWLAERAPAAALGAADQFDAAIELLRDFPLAAPLTDEHHRELTVPFGRVGPTLVTIVRVLQGRQRR
ncbi:type II toxin-antitoxin system RelE/ParE family toxin [Phenylobacterium sp.]|uniref:type II toxin-antitoxin system RelE/ParE family toxin n=1 Tax=Phenylobacterium sp. TaxID=1871053 RepID=UPI002FE11659